MGDKMSLEKMVKKYIITTAQREASLNNEFLDTLERYKSFINAEKIIVLPTDGASVDDEDINEYFYTSSHYEVTTNNVRLNKNIQISNYAIKPQQIDPVTGLARFAQDDSSTIFASTKQRMKVIPNSNIDLPKVIMTTGACTHPRYRDNRIGRIAAKDHIYGAIVVEVEGNKWYHYRQIQAQKNGIFYDLGTKFDGKKKPYLKRPEALVLGDLHVGDTNPKVLEETYAMIKDYKPKRVILHDVFNNHSISHHEDGKIIDKYKRTQSHTLLLEKELKGLAEQLYDFAHKYPKTEFVVVKSNHDEGLERYLNEARFTKEPQNALIGSKLLTACLEGYDPLEYGVNEMIPMPKNITFLQADSDYKVRGWQLANHGHLGANGARGSIRSIEWANGKSITAHSHTPEIFRNVYKVGTSTNLKLSYNRGYSSWLNTHGFLYDNGRVQLVNIVNGKHRGDK